MTFSWLKEIWENKSLDDSSKMNSSQHYSRQEIEKKASLGVERAIEEYDETFRILTEHDKNR